MEQENNEREIDLMKLFLCVFRRKKFLILLTILGLIAGIFVSVFQYTQMESIPDYSIKTSFAIVTKNSNGNFTGNSNNPNSSDIHLAEDMADSVIYVIKSKRTIYKAIESTRLVGVTADEIVKNLEVSQYADTQIIKLNLRWNNEQEGLRIVNAIIESVPSTLVQTLDLGSVNVIEEAESTYVTSSLLNIKLIVIFTLAGFVIAGGIVVVQMLIHPTIDSKEDLKQIKLDYLGVVPYDTDFFEKKSWLKMLETDDTENFLMADVFEGIAHILDHTLTGNRSRTFYLTSTIANEGKSVIAVNLAGVFSHIGKKVLLVDLDLRNPTIGSLMNLNVDYEHTLNSVFFNQAKIEDTVVHINDKFDVLLAKVDQKNMYVDEYLVRQINQIKENYDLVLIDSGPVGLVSNTMMINKIADEAIMIIQYNTVLIELIKEAVKALRTSGIKVDHCILNSSNETRTFYARKYYSNYYADSKQNGERKTVKKSKGLFKKKKEK